MTRATETVEERAGARVAVRVDGSAEIGSGHVRRMVSLAQMLRRADAEVRFVMRDFGAAFGAPAVAARFPVEWLPPVERSGREDDAARSSKEWAGVPSERDVEDTASALSAWTPDWMVVDHYGLDAIWHRGIAERLGCRIAVIDDLGDRLLSADLLVDHNPSADHRFKYQASAGAVGRLLGGPAYALLSPAYADPPRHHFQKSLRSIGIFVGGADVGNFSEMALAGCRAAQFSGPVEIVSTSANPRLDDLAAAVERDGRATLTLDLADLADFFARHDLQIGAGGGASWERCRIAAPAIVLRCADNQAVVTAALRDAGAALTVEAPDVATIAEAVATALADAAVRREIAERSAAMVDGRGTQRVALAMLADRAALRPAAVADAPMMLSWRNHPSVRGVSRDGKEIERADHLEWLARVMADPDRTLLIAQIGKIPFGVLRYDRLEAQVFEVSIYLDPAFQGLGLGLALLAAGESWLVRREGPVTIEAEFLEGNAASRRLFERSGFFGPNNRVRKRCSGLLTER